MFITSLVPYLSGFANADIDTLRKTSKAFSEISKKATPAVVFIKAQYGLSASSKAAKDTENSFDLFGDEFFRRFFGNSGQGIKPKAAPQIGAGSGFIVSEDGYIVTNHHVIKDARSDHRLFPDGKETPAKIIGSDSKTDIAVLKVDHKKMNFLSFGNSEELDVGEWVIAIGSPFELQASVTVGVVSAKKEKT